MHNAKNQVSELLERLPDDCTLEDVQYHLYVVEKIEKGIARAEKEGVVDHAVAEKRLRQWLED